MSEAHKDAEREAWQAAFDDRHEFDVYPEHFMSGLRNEFCAGWHAALNNQARAASPQAPDGAEAKLDKPAQVGNGIFRAGVKWSTVIGAAQRHYDYMQTPEKEAARIAKGQAWLDNLYAEPLTREGETVPEGFVLVPVEPTQAMLDCWWDALPKGTAFQNCTPRGVYAAMLAASPAAESKTLPIQFGKGNFVVDTGTFSDAPAVFIAPAKFPGDPGQSSEREGNRTDSLVDGEIVLTFPSREHASRVANALVGESPDDSQEAHADDQAVDRFAVAMKEKMSASRVKGRTGWEKCSPFILSAMLRHHVDKGDPLDVANFCMMLWNMDYSIAEDEHERGEAHEIISHAISVCEAYEPETASGDLRIVTLRMDTAKRLRELLTTSSKTLPRESEGAAPQGALSDEQIGRAAESLGIAGIVHGSYSMFPSSFNDLCEFARVLLAGQAAAPMAGETVQPVELSGVAEVLENGDGFWRECSGCYETCDGHPVGHYPYSAVLKCHLGGGCSECGGIGAVWDDTDYGAMAEALEREEYAREQAEQPVSDASGVVKGDAE